MLRLDVVDLHWLEGTDPSSDLCAHGGIRLVADGRVVLESPDRGLAVSAGAVHLLRTLERDHTPSSPVGQALIPCCAFTMVYDHDRREVRDYGCPDGFDFWIRHQPDGQVLISADGVAPVAAALGTWRAAVSTFSSVVRAFYFAGGPKTFDRKIDGEWYSHFLREWEQRHQHALAP